MYQPKPFKRTFRPNNHLTGTSYIHDVSYAKDKHHYIRSFLIIQEDLKKILEFIEPCEQNLNSYSLRIQELYLRTCVEIEANFNAILSENGYSNSGKNLDIRDYHRTNKTHYLSEYTVYFPFWNHGENVFNPFKEFEDGHTISWYQDHQKIKHEKYENFHKANLGNLINSICGLLVLLSSQFYIFEFMTRSFMYMHSDFQRPVDALGGFFSIQFPQWPEESLYDFNWEELKNTTDKFSSLTF